MDSSDEDLVKGPLDANGLALASAERGAALMIDVDTTCRHGPDRHTHT
jgi:hypothetical protein